jgi:hypothetical protein
MTADFRSARGWCRSKRGAESTPVLGWEAMLVRELPPNRSIESCSRIAGQGCARCRKPASTPVCSSPLTTTVRADMRATVRPTGCCSWSVPSHFAGGTRCRERLRNHLGALKAAGNFEGALAEIDRFLVPLPQLMDVTSPIQDAAKGGGEGAHRAETHGGQRGIGGRQSVLAVRGHPESGES